MAFEELDHLLSPTEQAAIEQDATQAHYEMLAVGKAALTPEGPILVDELATILQDQARLIADATGVTIDVAAQLLMHRAFLRLQNNPEQ